MDGPQAKVFYVWVALVRTLQFHVIWHENVQEFGADELTQMLGDLYILIRLLGDPRSLGWAATRPRQAVCLLLRCWLYPVLLDYGYPATDDAALQFLDLTRTASQLFGRRCQYTWRAYIFASDDDIDDELTWAATRRGVMSRRRLELDPAAIEHRYVSDAPGSHLRTLTFSERDRWEIYKQLYPTDTSDVGQRPQARASLSRSGLMHTLTSGLGLLMFCSESGYERWLHVLELLTVMGFPITLESQAITGSACSFSRGIPAPASRSHASTTCQIGNTMHVNFIGLCGMTTMLRLPMHGKRTTRTPPQAAHVAIAAASSTAASSSSNSTAIARPIGVVALSSGTSSCSQPPRPLPIASDFAAARAAIAARKRQRHDD